MSFLTSALSYRTPVLPIMLSSKLLPEMEAEQHKAEAPLRAAISKLSPAQQLDYLQKQVSGSTPCGPYDCSMDDFTQEKTYLGKMEEVMMIQFPFRRVLVVAQLTHGVSLLIEMTVIESNLFASE